jgi:hypothetical protein
MAWDSAWLLSEALCLYHGVCVRALQGAMSARQYCRVAVGFSCIVLSWGWVGGRSRRSFEHSIACA